MRITAAIRRLSMEDAGCCTVLFRSKDADDGEQTVSLSRVQGDCLFNLANLSEHDGHAPAWHACEGTPPGKAIDGLPGYVSRVLGEITEIVGTQPKKVEVRAVGEDGTLADKGEKFENPLQAIEKAVANAGNQAVLLSW